MAPHFYSTGQSDTKLLNILLLFLSKEKQVKWSHKLPLGDLNEGTCRLSTRNPCDIFFMITVFARNRKSYDSL